MCHEFMSHESNVISNVSRVTCNLSPVANANSHSYRPSPIINFVYFREYICFSGISPYNKCMSLQGTYPIKTNNDAKYDSNA